MKMCQPAEDHRETCEMGLLGAEEAGRRNAFNLTGPPPPLGRAAATKHQKPSSLNKRALLFHSPGGRKTEMQVSAELVPLEGWEGRSVRVRPLSPLPSACCLLPCLFILSSLSVFVSRPDFPF